MQRYLAGLLLIIWSMTIVSIAHDQKIETAADNQANESVNGRY